MGIGDGFSWSCEISLKQNSRENYAPWLVIRTYAKNCRGGGEKYITVDRLARVLSFHRGRLFDLIEQHNWGTEHGVYRFGEGRDGIRIDKEKFIHYQELEQYGDVIGDERVRQFLLRVLPHALPLKTIVEQLCEALLPEYEVLARRREATEAGDVEPVSVKKCA